MKVVLVSTTGKSLEFTCEDVNYSVNNGGLSNVIFKNPSINIPDCFRLAEVKSFKDDGSTLTINMR